MLEEAREDPPPSAEPPDGEDMVVLCWSHLFLAALGNHHSPLVAHMSLGRRWEKWLEMSARLLTDPLSLVGGGTFLSPGRRLEFGPGMEGIGIMCVPY